MPFNSPNYTQMPNELFGDQKDPGAMADMSEAELRVTLVLCRLTFGFHREEVRASLSTIEKMTGLSRHAVINAIEAVVKRGFIERIPTPPNTSSEWRVAIRSDKPSQTSELSALPTSEVGAQDVPQTSELSAHMKETSSKETKKETTPSPKNGDGKVVISSELPDAKTQEAILFSGRANTVKQAEDEIKAASWRIQPDEVRWVVAQFMAASGLPVPYDKVARKRWVAGAKEHLETFGLDFLKKHYPKAVTDLRNRTIIVAQPQALTKYLADLRAQGRPPANVIVENGKRVRVIKP